MRTMDSAANRRQNLFLRITFVHYKEETGRIRLARLFCCKERIVNYKLILFKKKMKIL